MVLSATTAIGLIATTALAIAWASERNSLRTVQAQLADAQGQLAIHARASITASASPSAPTSALAPATKSTPSAPSSSQSASSTPAFPKIKEITDGTGRVWFRYDQSTVSNGTSLTLTVQSDNSNPQLEDEFWTGERPDQTLVCGWLSTPCTWYVTPPPGASTPYAVKLYIAVRTNASQHLLSAGACYRDDSCDDAMWLQFTIE